MATVPKKHTPRILRNADTELGGLAQWIGRKCRNHNPAAAMQRRDGVSKRAVNTCKVHTTAKDDVHLVKYESNGRTFLLMATEITDDEEGLQAVAEEQWVEVGF